MEFLQGEGGSVRITGEGHELIALAQTLVEAAKSGQAAGALVSLDEGVSQVEVVRE